MVNSPGNFNIATKVFALIIIQRSTLVALPVKGFRESLVWHFWKQYVASFNSIYTLTWRERAIFSEDEFN